MNTATQDTPKTLTDLFISELADLFDGEKRIVKSMPKMAKAAISYDLKQAILRHSQKAGEHVASLEYIFELFEKNAEGKTCKATVGLLEEAEELLAEYKDSPCNDAALVLAIQKIIHYEIASYGCLHAWAILLDHSEAADLIGLILEEKTSANYRLDDLADTECNINALGET